MKGKELSERAAAALLLGRIERDKRFMRYSGYAAMGLFFLGFVARIDEMGPLGVRLSLEMFRMVQLSFVVWAVFYVKLQLWHCPRCKQRFYTRVDGFRFGDCCTNCGMNIRDDVS